MPADFLSALLKRRTDVDSSGQTWESAPEESSADASHLTGLKFDAPSAKEWLQQLEPTPEEDALAGALADGLAERAQDGPQAHVPLALTEADARKLKELEDSLQALRLQISNEANALSKEREDIVRRETELVDREKALQAERDEQQRREAARRDYPQPEWLDNIEGTINVGVVGNSGVGKSLLINKLRRVRPQADGWAPVGVNETTARPTVYTFPGQPRVRLWDVPGAGTQAVPSSTYVADMGLRYFDRVVIVSAGRFTQMEVELKAELEQHNVPFFMVRTKVDIDVWNNREDNNASETDTLQVIREDLMQKAEVKRVFLVSARDPDNFDMPSLLQELFPGLKRQMDKDAPVFCPGQPGSPWNDPWAMPPMYSASLAGLQGRWQDSFQAVYFIQGNCAHVTLKTGQSAVVPLQQRQGTVHWCQRWFVKEEDILKATRGGELRWRPEHLKDKPLVWWWCD